MKELLKKLHACEEAREWAGDKTWEEIYNTCHRGDWLLWLFQRTNPNDKRRLVLVGAHCANTVRHLMLNERIKLAVDVAFSYGEGKATEEELADAAKAAVYMAAYTAIYPTNTVASNAAAANAAADAAICAASAAAYAAAASAANAADIAADIAREQNQKQTADICRKYLPIEIWNIERGRK